MTTSALPYTVSMRCGGYARISLLGQFFLFFSFFPYLSLLPFPFNTDLQPYAFGLSLLVLAESPKKLPLDLALLLIPAAAAFTLWIFDGLSFFGLRSFASYLSLFTISSATYVVLRKNENGQIMKNFTIFATYAWLTVGVIQYFIDKAFMSTFIPNMSLDQDRGVTSLATEPSFYGIYCLCLMGLNYTCNNNDKTILMVLLLQITLLAQSTGGVLLLSILIFPLMISSLSARLIPMYLASSLALWIGIMYLVPEVSDLRLAYLLQSITSDPLALLQTDVSVNARIGHMLFSIYGCLDRFFLPHGFNQFHQYVTQALSDTHTDYIWLGLLEPDIKIMSGYGSALFELGLFGLVIPLAFSIAIYKYFKAHPKQAIFVALSVHIVMLSAIQLSLPMLGILVGYMSSQAKMRLRT